jgi:undecaprenyl pyrophosphate phosphatase UppP
LLIYKEDHAAGTGFVPLLTAIIAAFLAGYASIGLFMKVLEENRLYYLVVHYVIAGCTLRYLLH